MMFVKTPRFGEVKISKVFRNEAEMFREGYTEFTGIKTVRGKVYKTQKEKGGIVSTYMQFAYLRTNE